LVSAQAVSALEELQADLDDWVGHCNAERTHQEKICCGRTPMRTLVEENTLWQVKVGQRN